MLETIPFIEDFPYLGLFALLILGTLGLPFPEDGILLLSGLLTAHNVMRPFPTFLVVYLGLLTTDFLLYSVGKKCGRRLLEHKRFQKIITNERLTKLEEKFKKWGALVVFFGRHLLGLRAQIFLVAGVMRMPWKKFLVVDGTSALITITFWGGFGYIGGNSVQALKKDITNVEEMVMVILATLIGSILLLRYLKKRNISRKPGPIERIGFQKIIQVTSVPHLCYIETQGREKNDVQRCDSKSENTTGPEETRGNNV